MKVERWWRGEIDREGNALQDDSRSGSIAAVKDQLKTVPVRKLLVYLRLDGLSGMCTLAALLSPSHSACVGIRPFSSIQSNQANWRGYGVFHLCGWEGAGRSSCPIGFCSWLPNVVLATKCDPVAHKLQLERTPIKWIVLYVLRTVYQVQSHGSSKIGISPQKSSGTVTGTRAWLAVKPMLILQHFTAPLEECEPSR